MPGSVQVNRRSTSWVRVAAWLLVAMLALSPSVHAQPAPTVAVVVDPRVELMSAVEVLSGYPLVTYQDFAYKHEVERYFAPYAHHRAVQLFREMSGAGFNFSYVPAAILAFGVPPALEPRVAVPPDALAAAGGPAQLQEFMQALRAFAVESHFMRFFDAHRSFYRQEVERTREEAEASVSALQAYTGQSLTGATVVLGPLLHDGGFATKYQVTPDSIEAYALVGPQTTRDGQPDFGDADRLRGLVGHEFAHLVVNPLTSEHRREAQCYAALYAPMAEAMQKQAYTTWEIALNEHIVRAITVRLAFRERGKAAEEAELKDHLDRGFTYLPALTARLQEYEADRQRYPTLATFYPQLLEVFAEAAGQAGARVSGTGSAQGRGTVAPQHRSTVLTAARGTTGRGRTLRERRHETHPSACESPPTGGNR